MDNSEFARGIPNLPKVSRWPAIRQRLEEMLEVSESTSVANQADLLKEICFLGKNYERLLLESLASWLEEMAPNPPKHIVKFVQDRLRLSIRIDDRQSGADLNHLAQLLQRLEQLPRRPRRTLDVNFNTPHAYVYGICAIAAWATQNATGLSSQSQHDRVSLFLDRAGFLKAWGDKNSEPVQFDTDTILGFTRIDVDSTFQTDTHAGRLVDLFKRNMLLDSRTAASLSICFAELIENAVKHAAIRQSAWLFANYHPQHRIMHVCICDRGIGIRQTFLDSQNPRLIQMAEDRNSKWIKEASEPLVTSKSLHHSGYGLYITRELCRRNGGLFLVISGDAGYALRPSNPDSRVSEVEEFVSLETPWNGTLFGLQFHLDRPFEVRDVYDSLPSTDIEGEDADLGLFND